MTCLIICGGNFYAAPENITDKADFIIACDKGLDYAIELKLKPDLVIGDFDSCTSKTSNDKLNEFCENIIKLPVEKDDTDTMAAVKYAMANGYSDFIFICADGGRFDHYLCNLQTMNFITAAGGTAVMYSDSEEIHVITNTKLIVQKKEGWSLSVFALSDKAKGVFEKGTKWSLNNAVMKNSYPYGISNEWVSEAATIGVKKGTLAVILSKIPEQT